MRPAEGRAGVGARGVAAAAYGRRESRGAHVRLDFPQPAEPPQRTYITLSQADAVARSVAAAPAEEPVP